ncbi:hypothetical protein [Snodgrassella gandavensis]|uniref:hypothetical protein n=1 Tax=Snodgrassella gandavensis TaxID=2946698 RepID=UPI001EF5AD30|nr:hypothetical protein [Snodgrassella gandavensis]
MAGNQSSGSKKHNAVGKVVNKAGKQIKKIVVIAFTWRVMRPSHARKSLKSAFSLTASIITKQPIKCSSLSSQKSSLTII